MEAIAPDFYLASSEGYGMEEPRRCWRLKRLRSDKRDDLLLIRIEPPLPGQKYGLGNQDVNVVLVAPRHQGATLFPINEWPLFVHVARLLIDNPQEQDRLHDRDFESVAWAELYRSEREARLKEL